MNIKSISFTMFFLVFIPFNLSAAAAKSASKRSRIRSPLYLPVLLRAKESPEVIKKKRSKIFWKRV